MESIKDLNFPKGTEEEEIMSKLKEHLMKKPSMEKVSCDEISKISLPKDAENAVVAFIVRPLFLHPKIGFTSFAI